MSLQEPEYFNQRALLLKIQTNPGQSAGPEANVNGFELFDGKAGVDHDKVERKKDRPFFTGHPFASTNRRRFIEGGFELAPPAEPGTDPAACAPMLLIGGMAQTLATGLTRYNPISREIAQATAWWYHGGRFGEVLDCRAAISGLSAKIGERLMAQTRVQGSFDEITEAELPEVDYSAFPEPPVSNAENSGMWVNGVEVAGKELSVDFGTALTSKQFTQLRTHRINDRVASGKLVFTPPPMAEFDPWALQKAHTKFLAWYSILEDDGRVSVLVLRTQIDTIGESDVESDYLYEINGPAIATDSGGDEFYVAFGAALTLTGDPLDSGQEGSAYSDGFGLSDTLFTSLAAGTWSISEGALPEGLTISATTGVISGTPEVGQAGDHEFTVRHRDAVGRIAEQEVTLTIAAA